MKKMSKVWVFVIGIFFAIGGLLAVSSEVSAAILYTIPSNATYEVGDVVSLTLFIDTEDSESANAMSASILFPKEKVQLTSISKTGSIIDFWATEPSFSNQNGTASLEGVVLNPGFQGKQGKVVTLKFKVIALGKAEVLISSASVLANDGTGTNILSRASGSTFTLIPATPVSIPAQKVIAPKVSTSTSVATSTPIASLENNNEPKKEVEIVTTKSIDYLIEYLSLTTILVSLIFLLLYIILRGWLLFVIFKNKIKKETKEAKTMVHSSFVILRDDVIDHIKKLEKARRRRILTEEEEEFITHIKSDLKDAEIVITKEIEDISK